MGYGSLVLGMGWSFGIRGIGEGWEGWWWVWAGALVGLEGLSMGGLGG